MFGAEFPHFTSKIVEHSRYLPRGAGHCASSPQHCWIAQLDPKPQTALPPQVANWWQNQRPVSRSVALRSLDGAMPSQSDGKPPAQAARLPQARLHPNPDKRLKDQEALRTHDGAASSHACPWVMEFLHIIQPVILKVHEFLQTFFDL